ncbi:MAG TPA: HAMP domain-containing sensor histidine kinase [Oscillospiraceae bacterium]|nr:HAMP domain-containing sensor histidine kinase [Oscillospiraceae bacterium]
MYIGTKDDPKGFIFLNTPLEPIDSTISVLQEQLIYITIALLSLGLIISFFMAKKISHPIVNITKSAENLAHGNYNVSFDGEGYDESEKLASTLNYASTEISKVDNLRRDLIANISHDLRTPLTMVKAYAEMIRDLSGGIPEKREEHINIIIEESNRLSALVNDILDLSKIESGNQKLNISSFKIKEKLMEVLERYKLLSEKDGYEFIYEEDDEAIVSGDVIKIEQVLYNFINNAVNYTGEDKKVIIRQINKVKSVRIEISDTGKGIEPEMLPLIFDRYYRGEKSQREVIGTGLGLSIIKVILKNHNYPFGVQSELDKGSTFWFEIKREKEKSIKIRQ